MQLSHVVFRNLGTKLLALVIACGTWFVLSGQRRERISQRSYRIPISIVNVPPGTMLVSPLPDAIDVRIRGAFTPLRGLDPAKLEAVVDLADAVPGERRYALGTGDINVPNDVEVVAISPAEIRFVLDAVAEKIIPIVAEITGQPAAGAHVDEVTADPRTARIVGPARTLARIVSLPTEPVSVEGRDAGFSTTATLAPLAPGVRLRQGQAVTVRVRIRPAPALGPEPTPTPGHRRKGKS